MVFSFLPLLPILLVLQRVLCLCICQSFDIRTFCLNLSQGTQPHHGVTHAFTWFLLIIYGSHLSSCKVGVKRPDTQPFRHIVRHNIHDIDPHNLLAGQTHIKVRRSMVHCVNYILQLVQWCREVVRSTFSPRVIP